MTRWEDEYENMIRYDGTETEIYITAKVSKARLAEIIRVLAGALHRRLEFEAECESQSNSTEKRDE